MSNWKKAIHDNHGPPSVWPLIETGDGWRPLIEYAYEYIAKHKCLSPAQVKEKFGGLRFYVDHDYECECAALDEWYKIEAIIEALSYKMCETCGAYGEPNNTGWIRTRCSEHAE